MSIETTTQTNDKSYSYINLDYMDMMSDGDASMKKVMLEMLLEELPQELEKMNQLCTQCNWSELGSVSHKMKSTLAFVGNEEMTNANKDIEQLTKDGTLDSISNLLAQLTALGPKTLEELKMEFDRI